MKPCMAAVWELVVNYKCSAVFCTATQPNLEKFLPEEIHPTELAPNPEELFEFYKRVEVKDLGYLTDEALIAQVSSYQQVLCIVNTRRHAQQIFKGMDKDGRFHLSTLMCPAHRKKQLIEIQKRLSAGNSCRVISTSVMESGIDIDFPVGFRAIAGLDSINQAAGRVNREMKLKSSQLYIFEPVLAKNKKTPKYVQQASAVTSMILRDFPDAPISIPAVEKYFEQLYSVQDPAIAFDFKSVMKCFENINGEFEFETAASRFRIIDDLSQPVIIPYDERALSLIDELKYSYSPMRILRRLQPFTVSIYQNEFDELCMKGAIWKINDRFAVLDSARMDEFYDPETGLNLPEGDGGSALFF